MHPFRITISLLCLIALFFVHVPGTYGQKGNPFELRHRLKKMNLPDAPLQDSVQEDSLLTDLVKEPKNLDSSESFVDQKTLSDTIKDTLLPASANEPIAEESVVTDHPDSSTKPIDKEVLDVPMPEVLQSKRNLIFGTFIILALFLTVVISFDRKVVNHILRSILNDNYLNMLHRDQKGRWPMQFVFLYVFFLANVALFIFLSVDRWEYDRITANLLVLFLIVLLIYSLRHLSLNYLGNTFEITRETGQFSFTIMLFNIFLGLILMPINLFVAFAPVEISSIFIYIGLIVIVLTFVLRQLRGLFIANRFLINHQFHFILYLCTVEIAPILVLIKFFQPYFN